MTVAKESVRFRHGKIIELRTRRGYTYAIVKLDECPTKGAMEPIKGLWSPMYVRRYMPAVTVT